jgi:hypothetical protein
LIRENKRIYLGEMAIMTIALTNIFILTGIFDGDAGGKRQKPMQQKLK